ncbi:hypothetical protein IAD21_02318 [Abditibacteriota bacterium]|nr:hypothetical protein IAD21_02318 [Abditibacteriota bacterium]
MIKTTSFAPSRPAQTVSNSSSRSRQHVIKAARTRAAAQAQPNLGALFAAPTPVPEISAAQAREILQSSAPKPKSKTKAAPIPATPIASLPSSRIETTMPSTSPASPKTPRTTKSKAPTLVPLPAPVVVAPPAKVAPIEVVAPGAEPPTPQKAAPAVKKSRRPRVPVNLAEQYGQSLSKRVESGIETVVEDESPKKRLSRAERQARRELMSPDDDLLARLHRVHNAVPTAKPEKRPRGWRFDCGRCGQTSYFQTTGAICKCGALAIKE